MFPLFPLFPHAYDFELIQAAIAVVGFVFALFNLYQCVKDLRALVLAGVNGRAFSITKKNFISALFMTMAAAVLTILSSVLVYIEPPPPLVYTYGDTPLLRAAVALEIAIFALNFIVTVRCMIEVWLRRKALQFRVVASSHPDTERRSGEDRRQS